MGGRQLKVKSDGGSQKIMKGKKLLWIGVKQMKIDIYSHRFCDFKNSSSL